METGDPTMLLSSYLDTWRTLVVEMDQNHNFDDWG